MYFIEKNLTRLRNQQSTYFLDPKELFQLKGKLKKSDYSIYYPYPDSEKVIVYNKEEPIVLLYEIVVGIDVRHQDILGAMYSLNIASELFGDILIINHHYYIYILPIVQNYFESNFLMVKNAHVELKLLPVDTFKDYHREYQELEINVSSNRIDVVVCSICNISRSKIADMIKKKEITLNYDFLDDSSYKLKEDDTFSIKRIGKYRYKGILRTTKGNHLIIQILKYI